MVAPMRSRLAGVVAGVVVLALLGTVPAYASKGAYFGTALSQSGGESSDTALLSLESEVGRHFHMYRLYRPLNDTTLRGGAAQLMKSRGQPIYLNVTSEIGNRCVSWHSVAAGAYNTQLHSIARQVRKYHYKVFFSWNHEMQGNCKTGTAADYRASYKRVRKVFKKEHVTNAVWVWVVAAGNINNDPAKAAKFLPGKVDLIGVDGYNRAGDWRGVKEIFAAAHKFATNHGHRLFPRAVAVGSDGQRDTGSSSARSAAPRIRPTPPPRPAGSRTRTTPSGRGTSPGWCGRTSIATRATTASRRPPPHLPPTSRPATRPSTCASAPASGARRRGRAASPAGVTSPRRGAPQAPPCGRGGPCRARSARGSRGRPAPRPPRRRR